MCGLSTSTTSRFTAWLDASEGIEAPPATWLPNRDCRIHFPVTVDCEPKCLEASPNGGPPEGCRLLVSSPVEQCPDEFGWQETDASASSDMPGWRLCEVRPLEGDALDRCEHDLQCADCPPGFCFTEVPELSDACALRGQVPLPRIIGDATGWRVGASFRLKCEAP